VEEMRAEKSEKFIELKEKRGDPEYDEWFLRYRPQDKMIDKQDKIQEDKSSSSTNNIIKNKDNKSKHKSIKNKNKKRKSKTKKRKGLGLFF
jgi:hypothetical protein